MNFFLNPTLRPKKVRTVAQRRGFALPFRSVLFLWLLFSSAHAIAAPTPAEQFIQAQKLFDTGRAAQAETLFREVYRLTNSPNAHFMVARSLVAQDRLPEAHAEMTGALREATDAAVKDPAKYETTRDAAAAQLALLDRKLAKLIVMVVPPTEGTKIKLDESELPSAKLGLPLAVMPGQRVVVVTFPNGKIERREVTGVAGETTTVALSAPATTASAGPTVTAQTTVSTEPVVPASSSAAPVRTAGFVIAGAGLVGGVLFAVAAVNADGTFSRVEKECGGKRCTDPAYSGLISDGQTWQTVANVALVAAPIALVAGGLMVAFGGPRPSPHVSLVVTTAPSNGSAFLRLQGQF